MKQVVLGLIATLAAGSAFAQQPTVLAHAYSEGVTVNGVAVPAASSMGAKAGDVIAVAKGEAKVTYGNGCAVTVTVNASYTVEEQAPKCAAPAKMASTDARYYWAAAAGVVVVAAAVGGGGDDKPSSP